MGLQFRRSQVIPNFVYKTLVLPKTLEQCAYLIEQKQVELQSTQQRIKTLQFQKGLIGDDDFELEDIDKAIRSVRNAQSTLHNQLILLTQWRKDFVNIAELPITKKKERSEIKDLKVKVNELGQQVAQIKASNSLKRLACQVEQFVRYFVQLVFIEDKPISPLQILELQRITREISGREPDPNFLDIMQPYIDKAKLDREVRRLEPKAPPASSNPPL